MTTERNDIDAANDFLMSTGIPSFKFENVGDIAKGEVAHAAVRQQTDIATNELLFWPDGNPRNQMVVTLQMAPENDEDDGLRNIYVKGQMAAALRDAIRKTGERGIGVGGKLAVKYAGDGERTKSGFNPPKQYEVRYQPPPPQQVEVPDEDDMPF